MKPTLPMTHPQQQLIRDVIARVFWSKVTEIGGGKCYIQTNLDDISAEIATALSAGAVPQQEPPVLKSVRSLDGRLLAQFYAYDYFEEVMRALHPAVPALPALPAPQEQDQ